MGVRTLTAAEAYGFENKTFATYGFMINDYTSTTVTNATPVRAMIMK